MRFMFWGLARTAGLSASLVTAILVWPCSGYAAYWNVFNLEGESSISAEFVTYATLSDMLHDTNRTGDVAPSQPFVDANIVDSGSDGKTYWNLFNLEGESSISAEFVTYATLSDMLHDTNRTGDVAPSQPLVDANIVGSGSDGKTYWNLFNLEGESSISAEFVTYATLSDMLHDTNRTGDVAPSQPLVDANIVGSGSDGKTYWNLFNLEGESSISAEFVTYATLSDMLHDTNRTGDVAPSQPLVDANIVGSGADIIQNAAVPEPRSLALLCTGLLGFGLLRIRRRRF